MRFNFAETVTEKFMFLNDLGFSLVEALPTFVQYRKDGIKINIYHGRQSYELGFEIVRLGKRYSMSELIRIIDPEAAARYRNATATTQKSLTEELARLRSHLDQFRSAIDAEGEVGKRLDFLLQELNREANTVLAKSTEVSIKDAALAIKAEVEKLREQVQNVE